MPDKNIRQIAQGEIKRTAGLENMSSPWANTRHAHNGSDSPQVHFDSITGRQFILTTVVPGNLAATSGYYGAFFVSPFPFTIQTMIELHRVAGTHGSAVVLAVIAYPPNGDTIVVQTFNLKSTAGVPQSSSLLPEAAPPPFPSGTILALGTTGTLTSVDSVNMTVLCNYENTSTE